MSTDPVQLLIDAGAIPSSPFDSSSRYYGVALAVHQPRADDTPRAYVTRRFVPRSISIAAEHLVRGGERPDTLAAKHLGDALSYWRVADANAVIDPHELTDTVGARIAIPFAPGMGGA